jgi:transcriptional regulator with XRE-family HTH domain
LLRALRTERGLTAEEVAERLLCSPAKVSRMETGHRGATARDVRDLCDLFGVSDPAQRDHLMSLAREGKTRGWWQPFELPYATYVGLEAEAISIRSFEADVIPGLLQTRDYARALHESATPRLPAEVIDQRIEVRVTRQALLSGARPLRLVSILDEAVLRRVVGGRSVMHGQIEHIVSACGKRNVTVQVIPFVAGAHPALNSPFTIIELEAPVPSVVYVESLAGQIYMERTEDIKRYEQIFDNLCTIAMGQNDSIKLMMKFLLSLT